MLLQVPFSQKRVTWCCHLWHMPVEFVPCIYFMCHCHFNVWFPRCTNRKGKANLKTKDMTMEWFFFFLPPPPQPPSSSSSSSLAPFKATQKGGSIPSAERPPCRISAPRFRGEAFGGGQGSTEEGDPVRPGLRGSQQPGIGPLIGGGPSISIFWTSINSGMCYWQPVTVSMTQAWIFATQRLAYPNICLWEWPMRVLHVFRVG